MAEIRHVTDQFSVAPQVALEDFPSFASQGFRLLINNRPDGEAPDQPTSAEAEAAAKSAGLAYIHAPFVGQPTADSVKAVMSSRTRTLAYCRSGTRSITAWAMAQASEGCDAQEIVEAAQDAGYNLGSMGGLLRQLGAR